MYRKPSDLLVIAFMGLMTLIAGNEILARILEPAPQTAPAVVTSAPPRTVVITPIAPASTTTPATTTSTAHDALQADLEVLQLPDGIPCTEWASLALSVGWPVEELPNLLEEMWQESRCINVIPGDHRWNGGDHGLMQINTVWKDEVERLFGSWDRIDEPEVNLAMALEIWKWHDANRGCGWGPWGRSC